MLKFLGKTIVKAVAVGAKLCAFCVFVNELAYLDHEVRGLRREVDKLKAEMKG